jgi:hypothetical protein
MVLATDGFGNGWFWQRMVLATDGFGNGWF